MKQQTDMSFNVYAFVRKAKRAETVNNFTKMLQHVPSDLLKWVNSYLFWIIIDFKNRSWRLALVKHFLLLSTLQAGFSEAVQQPWGFSFLTISLHQFSRFAVCEPLDSRYRRPPPLQLHDQRGNGRHGRHRLWPRVRFGHAGWWNDSPSISASREVLG